MAWPRPSWSDGARIPAVQFRQYVAKVLLDLHWLTLASDGKVALHPPPGHLWEIRIRPWGFTHRTLFADIRRQLDCLVIRSCMPLFYVDSLISFFVRSEFEECYKRCAHNARDKDFLFGSA